MTNQQTRWGFITRLEVKQEKVMLPKNRQGDQYDSGDRREIWVLRCDCGHQWEVYEAKFPGKYTVRHCGREECPYAKNKLTSPPAGRRSTSRGIPTQVYMPMQMFYDVTDMATTEGLSFSKATVNLLKMAFQAHKNIEMVKLQMKQGGPIVTGPADLIPFADYQKKFPDDVEGELAPVPTEPTDY